MPLINDYQQVKDIYREAAGLGVALPVFCAEDRETLEAILASALVMGREIGVEDLPIIPAWTVRYPSRPQATFVTACGDPVLATRVMFSDLEALTAPGSPYGKLRVLPHLDHGIPWLDADVMEGFANQFASIMCDASEKPFAENIRVTAEYARQVSGRVVVEGAVDEIYSSGVRSVGQNTHAKNEATSVAQAETFLRETGVDILVPNVGTEHRLTAGQAAYRSERAREISAAVGRILCIHGTSSVRPEDLPRLPEDGFIKVNIYTTLAVHGGQALARHVLRNLGNILGEGELRALIGDGVLGERVLSADHGENALPLRPRLDRLANATRRDAWFGAVRDRCLEFLRIFGYARYAAR
ncbi:MAG: class II fructose-bisphosphate aldolase [Armatimonadetes bacterium]|nr:class II fructose-bisphosphate aldolase [Armatimonadota bacterium]